MNYKTEKLGNLNSVKQTQSYYNLLEPSTQVEMIVDSLKRNVSFISRYLNVLNDVKDYIIDQAYSRDDWDPSEIGMSEYSSYVNDLLRSNDIIADGEMVTCGFSFGSVYNSIVNYSRQIAQSIDPWNDTGLYDYEFSKLIKQGTIPAGTKDNESVFIPLQQFIDHLSNSLVVSDVYAEIIDNYGSESIQAKDYIINELDKKYDSSSKIVNDAINFVTNNVSELYNSNSKNELLINLMGGINETYSNSDDWVNSHDGEFTLSKIDWSLYTGKGLLYSLWNNFSSSMYSIGQIVSNGFIAAAGVIQTLLLLASKMIQNIALGLSNWIANTLNPLDYVITDAKSDNYTFNNMYTVPYFKTTECDYILHKVPVFYMSAGNGFTSNIMKQTALEYLNKSFIGTYTANDFLSVNTIKIQKYESESDTVYAYILYKSQIKPFFFDLSILINSNIIRLGDLEADGKTRQVHFVNPETAFAELCAIFKGVGLHETQQRMKLMFDKPELNATSEKMFGFCLSTSLLCKQLLTDSYDKQDNSMLFYYEHSNYMNQPNAGFFTSSWTHKLYGTNEGATNKDLAYLTSNVKASSLTNPFESSLGDDMYIPGRSDYINVYSLQDTHFKIIEDYFLHFARFITAPWMYNSVPSEIVSSLNKIPTSTASGISSRYSLLSDDEVLGNSVGRVLQAGIIIGAIALVSYGSYRVVNARKIAYRKNMDALRTLTEQLSNPNIDKTVSARQMRKINTMLSNGGSPSVILNTSSSSDDMQAILNTVEGIKSILK